MGLWRQLRWRIIAAQMLVVLVGVVTLIVTADILAARTVDPALLPAFEKAVIQALVVAALAATFVGLGASLLLAREILRPLRQLAVSSRRIANGHYDERIPVPASDELRDVAQSFNQMAEALARIEQQRVTLIGNVAHELRTPLAGLEGYLEGLLDGVLPGDPETISAMQHEVRRLRRLVDDLQHLSRVRGRSGDDPVSGLRCCGASTAYRRSITTADYRAAPGYGRRSARRSSSGIRRSGSNGTGAGQSGRQRDSLHAGGWLHYPSHMQ
ncbi:MAG: HAMP domain-containing protein [Roseiflexaceae bacterium]|nr:HAMP domain-containing protein [Roseiflexaceae bacterium]